MKNTGSAGSFATQNFLKQENRELRQQVTELKELLEHNKNALRASINYSKQPSSDEEKPYQKLINHLYRENDYLKQQLAKRHGESDQANSQVLMSHKLVEASQDYERTMVDELKDKITALKQYIRIKEERIDELEWQKPQFDNENMLHVKLVEITSPQIISMRFHDEADGLRQIIVAKNEELAKEKENKEQLYRLNLTLTRQINEFKSYGYDRSTKSKDLPSQEPRDMNYFMECQRKIYDEDQSSDQSLSSDEMNDHMLDHIDIADLKPANNNKQKLVPKLELRKAKEIQEIIVKKINIEEKKKHKVQNEGGARHQQVANLKKNLNREVLRNLQLSRSLDHSKRLLKNLEQQNHMLLKKVSGMKGTDKSQESSNRQDNRPMLERTHIQDLLQVGRDIYLNENLEQAIEGKIDPDRFVKGRSNSFSL